MTKAIADYTEAIELNPRHTMAYFNRGITYAEGKGQYDNAISDLTKSIEINPMDAEAYNYTAWIFATCPNAIYRDGVKAVELAKKAVELDPKAIYLDTLAAAYAEVGNFEDAITTQEKVIDLIKKEGQPKNLIDQGIEHLKSYKTNKPWREK
jgi:tetratricopeptide (TPR) repeat protein